jgi:hypothetical protein
MEKKKLSKSVRKFIRFQKARIRREISDSGKQKEMIADLYKRFDKSIPVKKESVLPKKKTTTKTGEKPKTIKTKKNILKKK